MTQLLDVTRTPSREFDLMRFYTNFPYLYLRGAIRKLAVEMFISGQAMDSDRWADLTNAQMILVTALQNLEAQREQ